MQGDFSRDSFDQRRTYSRVLNQQGRVQLDADWNESQSIQLHLLRTLTADLLGPHAGTGFEIKDLKDGNFKITGGNYYIDGWLCENENSDGVWYRRPDAAVSEPAQPFWSVDGNPPLAQGRYLVYLDVWERHLSWVEADAPAESDNHASPTLREVALAGADTASRAQVVWQVKAVRKYIDANGAEQSIPAVDPTEGWPKWIKNTWQAPNRGVLVAEADAVGTESQGPCAVPPQASYRGVENQLYRVEVHQGGSVKDGATFKWSRENGSVSLPVHSISGTTVRLASWWRDARQGLAKGDWVEVLDDVVSLQQLAQPLCRVKDVDPEAMTVLLETSPTVKADNSTQHPMLRRWDQGTDKSASPDGIRIDEGPSASFALEDGIRVRFGTSLDKNQPHRYRTGDFWLIPARAAIANIIWPRKNGEALPQTPKGVEHHYAPLAVVEMKLDGTGSVVLLRKSIKSAIV